VNTDSRIGPEDRRKAAVGFYPAYQEYLRREFERAQAEFLRIADQRRGR
jgi:hypothetical protein